jgi:ATP-binding cassette subfamily F protein 3
VLAGLGLVGLRDHQPLASLSSGQRTRLGLTSLLVDEPDLLLLDEPTNHLDLDALARLERFFVTSAMAALIVSHDRAFLDATESRTRVLRDGVARSYSGGWSAVVAAEAHERALLGEA